MRIRCAEAMPPRPATSAIPPEPDEACFIDLATSVLIGWAADGARFLEVNCMTNQYLQTLLNAAMEL